jgi:hypothetical protein
MNQFLLLLGIGLGTTAAAQAQVGLRLGGNLAKLHTTEDGLLQSSSSAKLGYQVGLTYQVPLTKWLALVPEVQYSQERMTLAQVSSYPLADAIFSTDSRQRLHYLNVPVLVRVSLGPVYVEAGPQVSVLLGGRQVGTTTASGWTTRPAFTEFDEPVTDHYRRFDAGPCVGIGVILPAGLGLGVRAYRGLVTLNQEQSSYEGAFQRQSVQASLTYQLTARQ